MRSFSLVFFILAACLVQASNSEHENKDGHGESALVFEKIEIEKSAKEFKIPTELWDLILNEPKEAAAEPAKHGENKEEKKEEAPILVWLPAKVQLSAVSEDILKNKNTEFEFSMGGGDIDFSKIVVGDKGSFYIKFMLEEFKDPSKIKVFFYSTAKKRKIDDDVYGAGCNVYFEITKKFFNENGKSGIKTNVTDNRHISIFGGHFIFASKNEGKIYLTQVSFKDSTKSDYFCQD